MKTKLTRTEYEAICAEKGIITLPAGKIKDEIDSTVWERWDENAAYHPDRVEANKIHAARQQAYFEEKQAHAEAVPTDAPPKTDIAEIELKKCSCGHTIPKTLVMSASMGSSCPECYDRMSA